MAILYDWYENPGESDDSEEKGLHPRIFLNGKVGTDKLCRMIHGRSSLSVGDVKNAFEMLAQICGEELREGREVHIEGLGYFAPILRSTQKVTRSTKNKWLKMELKTIGFRPDFKRFSVNGKYHFVVFLADEFYFRYAVSYMNFHN